AAASDTEGSITVSTGAAAFPYQGQLPAGIYQVLFYNSVAQAPGYSDHTHWSTSCMAGQPGTVTLGTVTVGSDGAIVGQPLSFDLPSNLRADTATPQESAVCISDSAGAHGNMAPLTIISPQWPNGASDSPSVSADGRYIAFASSASNLVGGDTNGVQDIFVTDTVAGTTRRISVSSTLDQANGPSSDPHISDDGRYVAFQSDATNLVPGDTNGATDVFVYDLSTGAIQRVSVSDTGAQLPLGASSPAISGDGSAIAFVTRSPIATGADCGSDSNNVEDVYIYSQALERTVQMASGYTEVNAGACPSGAHTVLTVGNGPSLNPSLSSDGRYVAFESTATNRWRRHKRH
ncbi:MAG: hypothetical protein M3065_14335, partial [Actinomycetota bacterium]|nr:hypothetical protein [Actinomycetota bacterium]